MRTAYLGSSDFAAAVLRALAASSHRPALVVTPADSRAGRGRRLTSPPVAEAARELGLELHQTADVNDPDTVERLRAAGPEAIAVCSFGQLIGDRLLAEHLILNVHPSLLPRWRGAAPIERALMAGDERTGVSIMSVTHELDAGPVALRQELAILPGEGFEALADRLAGLAERLLVRALDSLERGELQFAEQGEAGVTYAPKVSPAERRLDPARPAVELARAVLALNPHHGTYLELEGRDRLGVRGATPLPDGPPEGELRTDDLELVLGCSQGALRLELVQAPGGRTMPAAEFLRGHEPPQRVARAD